MLENSLKNIPDAFEIFSATEIREKFSATEIRDWVRDGGDEIVAKTSQAEV